MIGGGTEMELANRAEDENGAEEEPFLARRRQVVPWRRHGPKIVVHPEDMRRRLRNLPHSLRAELKLRADQLEEADACDTLADAARWLAIPERDLQDRATEDFIEACAKAGMSESTQRKLAKLHVDLVGRRLVWATNSSGPNDPVPHRGAFYLSYPQRQSRNRGSRYRVEAEDAGDANSLPGQLVCQGAVNNGAGQKAGWQQITLESGDSFFWNERRNQVTYGKPGDAEQQGGLVAGESMLLQEALEIQEKRTMNEEAWKALPGDHPNDDYDQRKWNRKRKEQACRLRVSGYYPLHMALCKEAEPQLSKAILEFNQAACWVRAPDGRLPLHQALIHWKDFQDDLQRKAQTELVYAILRAFPEACQVKEPLHGRLPLHCALRVRAADELVMEILDYYEEACRTEDSYGKKPLHYCATANTRLIKTENAVIVDNCRLLTFPPIDAKGHESTMRQYGLATDGFSLHESRAFAEHDKTDRDDNFDAVLQRCGIGEDERREHTLGRQLVSKDISLRVLALDPEAACKADEAGRTPAYLSLYNCTDDDVRRAIGQKPTKASIDNAASAKLAQLIMARDKQQVTVAESKLTVNETELAAAENYANETRLSLDNAKIQFEKSKAEAKIAEITYNAVRKELQEFVHELTDEKSIDTAVQQKLLEKKAAIEGLVTQKKRECRRYEKDIEGLTQEYETAMSRKTKLEQEIDQLQEDYERENGEWKTTDTGAQGKQQRLDTNCNWHGHENGGSVEQRTAAHQTVNEGITTDVITKAVKGVPEKEPKQAFEVLDQDMKTPTPRSFWKRFCCAQRH